MSPASAGSPALAAGHGVGIDVGGTKTKACLVRIADGAVLAEETRATPCARGGTAVLDLVVDMGRRMQDEAIARLGAPARTGVCLPELVSNDGVPGSAWNFEWRTLDYRTPLSQFGPVYLESDVRAAAFAEGWVGAGAGAGIFVFVTLSTGMAYTLMIDGRPYGGARGYAIHFAGAELVVFDGPDQDREVRQNLEVFAAGRGLGDRWGRLTGNPDATARDLFEAAARDARAAAMADNALLSIASYLGQIVNMLDPALVVLGGGIGSQPHVCNRLAELSRPFIFADLARGVPFVPAVLGDRAPAIGTAVLAHRAASQP